MSKKKLALFVLFVSLFIITLVCGTLLYCQNKMKLKEVYVAKYNLNNRTIISEDEIEKIKVPASYLSEDVYLDLNDIVGKYVKLNAYIPKGSFFYKGTLDEKDKMKDGISFWLKDGEVSYDIYFKDLKANQAYLSKGMYVDLYLTINKDKVVSDLLINNIQIIGLYDINHNEIKDYDDSAILEFICLAIPKESVVYLNKAQVIGDLSLILSENTYSDEESVLNKDAKIFEYLE